MKLASFIVDNRKTIGFALEDGKVVKLTDAFEAAGLNQTDAPDCMLTLIEAGSSLQSSIDSAAKAAAESNVKRYLKDEVSWLQPVLRPSKIVAVACNNKAITNRAKFYTDNPMFFNKAPSSLIGHEQPIEIRPDYGLTHPEAELAVVIGRRCKSLSLEEAMGAVFGYTIMNDITSVTLKSDDTIVFPNPGVTPPPPGWEHGEKHLTYHARSKSTDTFGPCGPWIVTKDEIPNPDALSVKVYMGDELCTEDNTGNLNYSVARVLHHLTKYMTLEAGDIVHIGTASKGKYQLRELDFQKWDGPCSIEIEGIGRLSNPIKRIEI
ncbi:fumarylacetoacetate hydrolase family protein [Metabacillus arenae]|uniref:Fumarylacetoacetate hydrolase family protein n=1 Tax=Metabacillus arenae TaxID=2771434 RepID=A0A926NJP2_9BACI|nr:fumarylacetoacetate hydrolase family protein [Metabacillus arenae]MBD1382315.1 fumarylacetoacetate hydrolase family protein [Metabacillus arenae]